MGHLDRADSNSIRFAQYIRKRTKGMRALDVGIFATIVALAAQAGAAADYKVTFVAVKNHGRITPTQLNKSLKTLQSRNLVSFDGLHIGVVD